MSPLICRRVTNPNVPHSGHESTPKYGSSLWPTSPAFSRTNKVPGDICSGIHSFNKLSSTTMFSLRVPDYSCDLQTNLALRHRPPLSCQRLTRAEQRCLLCG